MITNEMKEIINKVDKSWPKDYIIRYLYISLAPFFERDLNYFLASDEEKYRQYKLGFINNGKYIVCSTLADFYVNLFAEFNIKAFKTAANSAKIPLFAIVVEGDYGLYYLDPLNDLFNNQYGLKTTEFGVVPRYRTLNKNFPNLIQLKPEYIEKIDKYLHIYPQDTNLTNFFNILHQEMTNRKLVCKHFGINTDDLYTLFDLKMNFANQHLINIGKVNGPFERIKLYLYLEKIMFFKHEKKNITIKLGNLSKNSQCIVSYNLKDNLSNDITFKTEFIEEQQDNGQFVLKKIN